MLDLGSGVAGGAHGWVAGRTGSWGVPLTAQQITCTGQLLHVAKKKKFNGLPALVDNPHIKTKENLYKKASEFTNLEANLY